MVQPDISPIGSPYPVRFGFHSGQQYASVGECVSLWQRIEELGYDWASLFDHLRPPAGGPGGPCLDGPTLLAALAGATQRVRCGMMVSPVTWRHPAVAAMTACTLDQISHGRLEWGIGAGGPDLAFGQYGIIQPPLAERMDRLDEACGILTALWRGGAVTLTGRYYRLRGARLEPGPVQDRIPLVVGGGGEHRLLTIAARHADVWNTILTPVPDYRRKSAILSANCERECRDPRQVRRSLTFRAVLAATEQAAWARADRIMAELCAGHPDHGEYLTIGTPAQCAEDLATYHALGVTDFLLGARPPLDWQTIELLAQEVIPAFRS